MKLFDVWNVLKKVLHESAPHVYCKSRQVWWCHVGINIGSEQDGGGDEFLRPVIVLKVFGARYFLGVPETSVKKEGTYYVPIQHGTDNKKVSYALLNQVRVFSTKRLKKKIGIVNADTFNRLQDAYIGLIKSERKSPAKAGAEPLAR